MNFFTTPDQYLEIFKKNQSISNDFTQKCLESFYEINQINFNNFKANLEKASKFGSDSLNIKDPIEVSDIAKSQLASVKDDSSVYLKSIYKVNSKLTKDLAELSEINSSEFNKFINDSVSEFSKNAPAGSEGIVEMTKSSLAASSSTYDAMTNAAKQVLELVDSNMDVASKSTSNDRSKNNNNQNTTKSSRSRKAA
jgi:hypothetical protein